MVLVPAMTENFHIVNDDAWIEMTEEESLAYQMICEEEGEPISPPMIQDDGTTLLLIEDHDTGEVQEVVIEGNKSGDSSLHDWFNKSKSSDGKKGWVQIGGPYAGKPCARQPGQKSTPKCGSSKMKRNLSKKEEDKAFARKNRQDPNQPQKSGAAKPTNVKTEEFQLDEISGRLSGLAMRERGKRAKASKKAGDEEGYKKNMEKREVNRLLHDDRVNRDTERKYGDKTDYTKEEYVSEEGKKDACYHKVKSRYKVWPSAYASGALVKCRKKGASNWGSSSKKEEFEPMDEACWKGYTKKGMKRCSVRCIRTV